MAHDVFISFATADKAIADAACASLEARRIRCWVAPGDVQPGIPYPQSIMEGIRGSRVLVLILSGSSNTSQHVMREVERAVNCEVPVIPVRIQDVSLSGSMEYLVGSLQWLDALTPPLKPHLEALARRVLALLAESGGPEASAAQPSERAVLTTGGLDSAPMGSRAGSATSTSDPEPSPKADQRRDDGLKPKTGAMPAGELGSDPSPKQTLVAPGRQDPAATTTLEGTPRKRPNISRQVLYLGAVTLLAVVGFIIHSVATRRVQVPPPERPDPIDIGLIGQDVPQRFRVGPPDKSGIPTEPTLTKQGRNTEAASPGRGLTDQLYKELTEPAGDKKATSPKPKREWTNSIGMRFVRIDPGEFLMGTTKDQADQLTRLFPAASRNGLDTEQPAHSVRLSKAFDLGIHEVTQGQYQAVRKENPSHSTRSENLPVETVSWLDAVKFCNELSESENRTLCYRINGTNVTPVGGNGYRLPTEAEWEYACRADSTTLYPFGNDAGKLGGYAWTDAKAEGTTHPVGQKLPNAWGLYDMLGNVWEWCDDGYGEKYYASSPPADPLGALGALHRVIRGGDFLIRPWYCRPANRDRVERWGRSALIGFRVAAVIE
jgi:formylglycine-generating enzyme required for sulfatase activity